MDIRVLTRMTTKCVIASTCALSRRVSIPAATITLALVSISGCGKSEVKAGQALVSVNGEEITVHQLNDEMVRIDTSSQGEKKQVLENLIDRQVLQNAAIAGDLRRDPEVMLAIERAKASILAEAYLKTKLNKLAPPTKTDIEEYYRAHPVLFVQRRQFELHELVLADKEVKPDLVELMSTAKSIEEISAWLDKRDIQYARRQVTRNTADLPFELVDKPGALQKGKLLVIREGRHTILAYINDFVERPISLTVAEPQIAHYLALKKRQEAIKQEIANLRSVAKIEYLNKQVLGRLDPISKVTSEQSMIEASSQVKAIDHSRHIKDGAAALK